MTLDMMFRGQDDFMAVESDQILNFTRALLPEERWLRLSSTVPVTRESRIKFCGIPEHCLIVLFSSRTGSTYLSQMLQNTKFFPQFGESLNPSRVARKMETCSSTACEVVQATIVSSSSEQAFGFKAGFPGLSVAARTGLLQQAMPKISFVFLRRRDKVAQAVSIVRANITGRYHSTQGEARPVSVEDYDEIAIRHKRNLIEHLETRLQTFIKYLNRPTIDLYYEDIVERPQYHLSRILDFVGLPILTEFDTKVAVQKIADGINVDWINRFNRAKSL